MLCICKSWNFKVLKSLLQVYALCWLWISFAITTFFIVEKILLLQYESIWRQILPLSKISLFSFPKTNSFLDFCCFHFCDFRFNPVYNSILFSSPLILLSNLYLGGFCFPSPFFMCPHINNVNWGKSDS